MITAQFGFTKPGNMYPSYVNIRTDEDGKTKITIRSEAKEDGTVGDMGVFEFESHAEAMDVLMGMIEAVKKGSEA